MRLLVVDDSIAMRRILVTTLKHQGYDDVVEAADGREGMERLSTSAIDAVITDWIMPEMDGIEFVRLVRSTDALKDIPVLIMTTHATREHILAAVNAGVNGYILKPFTPVALCEKINAMMKQRTRPTIASAPAAAAEDVTPVHVAPAPTTAASEPTSAASPEDAAAGVTAAARDTSAVAEASPESAASPDPAPLAEAKTETLTS